MKKKFGQLSMGALVVLCAGCSTANTPEDSKIQPTESNVTAVECKPHNFVGWYCPDNLNGLPAVDMEDWQQVPVVNGRMPTLAETRNGSSLIYVDPQEYPDARALNVHLPLLASFDNPNSGKIDLIIVIQAFTVGTDSIVGFRFLNGGNGTALLSDIQILEESEISQYAGGKFVTLDVEIEAQRSKVRDVLTDPTYAEKLIETFDPSHELKEDWRTQTNVNFNYPRAGEKRAHFNDDLFGNYYIQNDFSLYTEKFLLLQDESTNLTTLKIVCGPFVADFEEQKLILNKWANRVVELSEK